MKEMYFTIAGCNHYYGSDFMEKGMKVKLVKEPDNEYDNEAIQVKIKGLDTTMKEMYFTIAGCNHYYGSDFMEKGMKVKLVKEPDNEYDNEAIQVKIKGFGKVGYVANSPYTVKGESMSAGRLYDKIGGKAKGKIVFVTDGGVICKVIRDGKDKTVMIEEDKVNDEDQLGFKI